MEKKDYPELKYDLLYKTERELMNKEAVPDKNKFKAITEKLGYVLALQDACKTGQCLVDSASDSKSKLNRMAELKQTESLYQDTLKAAYDVLCENGGKDIYANLLQDANKEQE